MARFNFRSPPKRVVLEQLRGSDTANSRGGSGKVFTAIETVYMSIDTIGGNEQEVGRQIEARTTHVMQGHFTATIIPQARIVRGTETFEVLFADNVEARDRWLIVQCVKVTV